jgi:hypothetical protein
VLITNIKYILLFSDRAGSASKRILVYRPDMRLDVARRPGASSCIICSGIVLMTEGQRRGRYKVKMAKVIIVNGGNVWIEVGGKDMNEITLISRSRI